MSQSDCKRIVDSALRCGHEINLETARLIWKEYSLVGGCSWLALPDNDELDDAIGDILYSAMEDYELDDIGDLPIEFGESGAGYDARDKWARSYDDLNGAPEDESDY